MEDEYTEEYLTFKIAEFINLKHRCKRQWKKLVDESMKIANEKGLVLEILDLNNLPEEVLFSEGSDNIPIYTEIEGKEDNCHVLLKLSKQKFPSLYRRFQNNHEKYLKLEKEMQEINDYYPNN